MKWRRAAGGSTRCGRRGEGEERRDRGRPDGARGRAGGGGVRGAAALGFGAATAAACALRRASKTFLTASCCRWRSRDDFSLSTRFEEAACAAPRATRQGSAAIVLWMGGVRDSCGGAAFEAPAGAADAAREHLLHRETLAHGACVLVAGHRGAWTWPCGGRRGGGRPLLAHVSRVAGGRRRRRRLLWGRRRFERDAGGGVRLGRRRIRRLLLRYSGTRVVEGEPAARREEVGAAGPVGGLLGPARRSRARRGEGTRGEGTSPALVGTARPKASPAGGLSLSAALATARDPSPVFVKSNTKSETTAATTYTQADATASAARAPK